MVLSRKDQRGRVDTVQEQEEEVEEQEEEVEEQEQVAKEQRKSRETIVVEILNEHTASSDEPYMKYVRKGSEIESVENLDKVTSDGFKSGQMVAVVAEEKEVVRQVEEENVQNRAFSQAALVTNANVAHVVKEVMVEEVMVEETMVEEVMAKESPLAEISTIAVETAATDISERAAVAEQVFEDTANAVQEVVVEQNLVEKTATEAGSAGEKRAESGGVVPRQAAAPGGVVPREVAAPDAASGGSCWCTDAVGCGRDWCLVHGQAKLEMVAEVFLEEEMEAAGPIQSPPAAAEAEEEMSPVEIAEELLETVLAEVFLEPEASKLELSLYDYENSWEEEDTWEDYHSHHDFSDRVAAIGYAEFEIGVWNSALWTSDMKGMEARSVEVEEVEGWGDLLGDDKAGAEGRGRNESGCVSDLCESPTNYRADDSVSTDEGIVGTDDDEDVVKGKEVEKRKKVLETAGQLVA